jgi:glycosyltransferase involved in cell wall biosynthesis
LRRGSENADVVHFSRGLIEYFPYTRAPLAIWDLDELPWTVRRPRFGHGAADAGKLEHERTIGHLYATHASRVQRLYVCSELELDPMARHMAVIPNVVKVPEGVAEPPASARDILFVGNLNYSPNVDGLRSFVTQVWPLIHRKTPESRLLVVGRAPVNRDIPLMALLGGDGIELHSSVSELTPFYRRAAIAVAPIQTGGGTRLKIIEAFGYHVAVVSTTVGCEGLAVAHEAQLLIADDPADFADACLRVLSDVSLRKRLSEQAYRYYHAHHTQAQVDTLIEAELALSGLLDKRSH